MQYTAGQRFIFKEILWEQTYVNKEDDYWPLIFSNFPSSVSHKEALNLGLSVKLSLFSFL